MASPFGTNNPGIAGLDEITSLEEDLLADYSSGVVKILENTAPSAEAGYGKIYVKSSDSLLYFKDDGGTEYGLTVSSTPYLTWNEETGTSATMAVNNAYIANNAAKVTLTLPSTASVGDTIRVVGKGAGGWRIAQNAGETIYYGIQSTTSGTGGYLEYNHRRDSVELVCVTTNSDWQVISSIGNIIYA